MGTIWRIGQSAVLCLICVSLSTRVAGAQDAPPPDSPDEASQEPQTLAREALQLLQEGRKADAESVLTVAIANWPVADGNTEGLEAAIHNLAAVYRSQGRFGEAIPMYERAVKLREARAGASDLSLLSPLNGLALAYVESGYPSRLKRVLDRALAVANAHRAEQSAVAADAFGSLGSVLAAAGRSNLAKEWLTRSLEIYAHLSQPHGQATALVWMGRVLMKQGHHRDAEEVFRRAMAPARLSPDPADLAAALAGLADLLVLEHRFAEAYSLFQEAESILDHTVSSGDPDAGTVLIRMAQIRAAQGRPEDAVALYREGFEHLGPALLRASPAILPALDGYARALRAVREYATAAKIDMDSMRIRVKLSLKDRADR